MAVSPYEFAPPIFLDYFYVPCSHHFSQNSSSYNCLSASNKHLLQSSELALFFYSSPKY